MSWTDERVETLRRLWNEGLSASQIAGQLQGGITRNAVIGKVHRLGLSGRAKPAPEAAQPTAIRARPKPAISAPRPSFARIAPIQGATALALDGEPSTRVAPHVAAEAVVLPLSERVTIMDLRESMCRWPLGDPATADFRFCGSRASPGMSYCGHHSLLAYQPSHDRRRDRDRRLTRIA